MNSIKRTVAVAELLLISPALLFMTAVFVRRLLPLQYEPARTAQGIVIWYSMRPWTLWVLLIALPFAVLLTGCATLLRSSINDVGLRQAARQPLSATTAHRPTCVVAAATVAAAALLAVVALHMLAN
jgi:hypothetical protein